MGKQRPRRNWKGPRDLTRAEIAEKFADPFEMLALEAANFHEILPTVDERRAFIVEFRDEYLVLAGFIAPETMHPADIEYEFNVFKRSLEFFENLPTSIELPDLPDLRSIERGPFAENHYAALAKARGAWWKANKLELTDEELIWMIKH